MNFTVRLDFDAVIAYAQFKNMGIKPQVFIDFAFSKLTEEYLKQKPDKTKAMQGERVCVTVAQKHAHFFKLGYEPRIVIQTALNNAFKYQDELLTYEIIKPIKFTKAAKPRVQLDYTDEQMEKLREICKKSHMTLTSVLMTYCDEILRTNKIVIKSK